MGKKSKRVPPDLYYRSEKGNPMFPHSVIYGVNIKIHDLVRNIISFYFPDIDILWDPTCGKENYQFAEYLENVNGRWIYNLENGRKVLYIASDIKRTKWNCVNGRFLIVDVLNPPYPFRDSFIDLIVYDPPYLVTSRSGSRGFDYGIMDERTVETIKQFYSERVFREFHRITRKGIIVKGADFYYPVKSDNLYLFFVDVLDMDMIRKYFKVVAVHIYRFFATHTLLTRARLSASLEKKGIRRPFTIHSYYLIMYKK